MAAGGGRFLMVGVRNGYLATWYGVEYEASPGPDGVRLYRTDPADGFTEVAAGRYLRVVAPDEVTVRYVQTTCAWQGVRFVVLGTHGSWLRVECLEDDATADRLGLERFDEGVRQGWAPMDRVTDLSEVFS